VEERVESGKMRARGEEVAGQAPFIEGGWVEASSLIGLGGRQPLH
jgi:hypothetical protein